MSLPGLGEYALFVLIVVALVCPVGSSLPHGSEARACAAHRRARS